MTICVTCDIEGPVRGPKNKLEIWEAKLFAPDDVPQPLAMDMSDIYAMHNAPRAWCWSKDKTGMARG